MNNVSTTFFIEKRACTPLSISHCVGKDSHCNGHLKPKMGATPEDGRAAPMSVSLDDLREQYYVSALKLPPICGLPNREN